MKLIDFYNKLIASMSSEFSNSLSLIANSLRYVLRNRLKIQNLKIYILINTTTTHCTYYIYPPLTTDFYPVLRVCVRVRARGNRFSIGCYRCVAGNLASEAVADAE